MQRYVRLDTSRSGKVLLTVLAILIVLVAIGLGYRFLSPSVEHGMPAGKNKNEKAAESRAGAVEDLITHLAKQSEKTSADVMRELQLLAEGRDDLTDEDRAALMDGAGKTIPNEWAQNPFWQQLASSSLGQESTPLFFVADRRQRALRVCCSDHALTVCNRRIWLGKCAVAFRDLHGTTIPRGVTREYAFANWGVSPQNAFLPKEFGLPQAGFLPYFDDREAVAWAVIADWLQSANAVRALPKGEFPTLYEGEEIAVEPARFRQRLDRIMEQLDAEETKTRKMLVEDIEAVRQLYSKLAKVLRVVAEMP